MAGSMPIDSSAPEVTPDLLGLFDSFRPKFVRRYAELGEAVRQAAARYVADVAEGRFPSDQESFH